MSESTSSSTALGYGYSIVSALYVVGCLHIIYLACQAAYEIRMYAINEYGRVIHEFDPYFNYRAAEYLWQHGWRKFFTWYDYQSWYPLGRPVGTTIYPGMQFATMWIKQFILPDWSINDICCFVPSWFGVVATLATAALCYVTVNSTGTPGVTKSILMDIPGISSITKVILIPIAQAIQNLLQRFTGSTFGLPTFSNPPALESAVFTALCMSIVPAHALRSVGGGYDNESVATTAMQLTFLGWSATLSSSTPTQATVMGAIAGLFYFYMVASWGGYVFVINLVGVHAFVVFLLRKMRWDLLYRSYTSFYVVGTILAMQIPVVNWTPIKSLEQLGPFGVFAGFQALQIMRILEAKYKKVNKWKVRAMTVLAGLIVALPVLYYLHTTSYFGPISSRVRGLFVKHTKTGNPLVDSVAEHQAASEQAYFQYLHDVSKLAPYGFAYIALLGFTAPSSFLIVYGLAAYFFSTKMVRLILLTAPIASICAGITLGYGWAWAMSAIFGSYRPNLDLFLTVEEEEEATPPAAAPKEDAKKNGKKDRKKKNGKREKEEETKEEENAKPETKKFDWGENILIRIIRLYVSFMVIREIIPRAKEFQTTAHQIAKQISHPTIITKGRAKSGEEVLVDDYREAYIWLRENTPEDARIMAWWDYGYQITGIANRTTIADGNTWNHEHIALLGRILTSAEKDAHRIARHLADYVLVWAGGGGDDLAKSPHLRRIANSVYRGICKEPTCRDFGMSKSGQPSPQLGESLVYKLVANKIMTGVEVDNNRFREVYRSKYNKVRIYKILSVSKESKAWVEDNKKCDAPGSWFCPGHYPPALEKILREKVDFAQLEDFNTGKRDEEYQKQYFENLNKKKRSADDSSDRPSKEKKKFKKLGKETIEMINENWENSEQTSLMWELISQGAFVDFVSALQEFPELAHVRSEDGRGPMWWAHEYNRPKMIKLLTQLSVSEDRTDANGIKPTALSSR